VDAAARRERGARLGRRRERKRCEHVAAEFNRGSRPARGRGLSAIDPVRIRADPGDDRGEDVLNVGRTVVRTPTAPRPRPRRRSEPSVPVARHQREPLAKRRVETPLSSWRHLRVLCRRRRTLREDVRPRSRGLRARGGGRNRRPPPFAVCLEGRQVRERELAMPSASAGSSRPCRRRRRGDEAGSCRASRQSPAVPARTASGLRPPEDVELEDVGSDLVTAEDALPRTTSSARKAPARAASTTSTGRVHRPLQLLLEGQRHGEG